MSMAEFRSWLEARDRDAEIRTFQRNYGTFGDVERRTFKHTVGETRKAGTPQTAANDGSLQVIGHAAVFGQPSVEMRSQFGVFTEYIAPGAFDKVLRTNPDVLLTWDHDTRYVLGRTQNGSLDLSVDAVGLRYWSRVAPTSYAEDLRVLMEGGYLDQSSFLFRIADGGEDWEFYEDAEGNDVVKRTIYEVGGLFDVCVCAAGAYPQTTSGLARTLAIEYAESHGFAARMVIPFKEGPLAPKDEKWNAGAQVDQATPDDLMRMCAWYDIQMKDDDGNLLKGAFKFPHHEADGDHRTVWRAVAAAMARLNQSTTIIPERDRQGVFNHLRKHYGEFQEDVPALKPVTEIEAKIKEITAELRAMGDVAWGPEEGMSDLVCNLECMLNDSSGGVFDFCVVDVSVNMDKVIACDWNDYTFWVIPFSVGEDGDPVLSDMSEWSQVETAWVTTTEGYSRNIGLAKQRREARMAGTETTEVTPTEDETRTADAEAEARAAAEVAEAEARAATEAAEAEARAQAEAAKDAALAEARARIAAAREV